MISENTLTLLGRLGAKPELKESKSGTKYCFASLATSESYKKKDSDEWTEETQWHRVSFFGRDAERICEKANKGDQLYCTCKLKYTAKEVGEQTFYLPSLQAKSYVLMPREQTPVPKKAPAKAEDSFEPPF